MSNTSFARLNTEKAEVFTSWKQLCAHCQLPERQAAWPKEPKEGNAVEHETETHALH